MQASAPDGTNILPVGRKTRAMLAILATQAPRPVLRTRLAELLWSRRPDEQARASLRQEIHRLLEALQPAGDIVRVARDHLSLRAELVWTDVGEVLAATVCEPSSLALLDGELLSGLGGVDPAFDGWLAAERGRMLDHARTVAEALLAQETVPDAVIPAAQQVLAIDRTHEAAWRALMRSHAERGERGLAVQAYDRCKAALDEVLQAAPSLETQRLAVQIRNGAVAERYPSPSAAFEAAPSPAKQSGTRLGVLPLQMNGTSEEEAHLAAGLAEEITAALARFRSLSLVSPTSLAQIATRDEATLRRGHGLDFVIDGSVQREANRLRITLRLLDLRNESRVVWARHFDRLMTDLLSVQDDISAELAGQIDSEISMLEGRRAAQHPQAESSAYDLVVRALPLVSQLRREDFAQAGELLNRALELDPDYASAHAVRAFWALLNLGQGWAGGDDLMLEHAGHHAERAIMLDPQDAKSLTIAGHVRAFLHHRLREGLELHGRALSLNPNLAMAWGLSAATLTYLGEYDEATRRYARYQRLAPMHPNAFLYDAGMALLELCKRDYAAAIVFGRRSSERNPNFSGSLRFHLSAAGHSGLLAEAATVKAKLLAIEPDCTVQVCIRRSPMELTAQIDHYAEGLRLAGLPEGTAEPTARWAS